MKLKERVIYYAFIIICLSISFGLCYQIAEARVIDWLLGGTRTVTVVLTPERTLDSEIDRLAIKYNVASSTARSIIYCESRMYGSAVNINRLPDGTPWSEDRGPFQINDYYHKATMENLGLNYYDQYDSLEYGFMLLSSQGVGPWYASYKCHGLK